MTLSLANSRSVPLIKKPQTINCEGRLRNNPHHIPSHSLPSSLSALHSQLGIWEYIQRVRDMVRELESSLQRTKDNVDEIQAIMRTWVTPIFERREGKRDSLLNLEDRAERLEKCYGHIRDSGVKIHALVQVSLLEGVCCEGQILLWIDDYR